MTRLSTVLEVSTYNSQAAARVMGLGCIGPRLLRDRVRGRLIEPIETQKGPPSGGPFCLRTSPAFARLAFTVLKPPRIMEGPPP